MRHSPTMTIVVMHYAGVKGWDTSRTCDAMHQGMARDCFLHLQEMTEPDLRTGQSNKEAVLGMVAHSPACSHTFSP